MLIPARTTARFLRSCFLVCVSALVMTSAVAQQAPAPEQDRLRKLEEQAAYQRQAAEQLSSWLGILLYRTDDMQKRQKQEAEASLIAPEFTPTELKLLSRWEINTDPFVATPKAVDWNRTGSPQMATPKLRSTTLPFHNYTAWASPYDPVAKVERDGVPLVKIDASLPKLNFSITETDTPYPTVSVRRSWWHEWFGSRLKDVYFEFDIQPDFESPAMFRYPPLMPTHALTGGGDSEVDFTSTRGQTYHLFTTSIRDFSPAMEFRFPFRVTALAHAMKDGQMGFGDLQRLAQLLQHGLDPFERIREVFQYGRMNYVWGGNTVELSPLDVFRAGIAGCGGINDLMGAILEMGGLRYRGVGGFNPINRVWFPGGGHAAVEVHDGKNWTFLDSFLDLLTPGIASKDFATNAVGLGRLPAARGAPEAYLAALRNNGASEQLTFRDLFKYRAYGDREMRLPMAHMMQLRLAGAQKLGHISEETYGLQWPLREKMPELDLETVPESLTVHARARYAKSRCGIQNYHEAEKCSDANATVSEWSTASFTINPRNILREDAARREAERAREKGKAQQ